MESRQICLKKNQNNSAMSLSQSRFSGSVIYDNEQNLLRYYKENITTIAAVRVCAGFYYKITVNEVMPKREFCFRTNAKKERR